MTVKDHLLAHCEDPLLSNIHKVFSPFILTKEKSSRANIPGVIGGSFIPFLGGNIRDFPCCSFFKQVIS